MKPYESAAEKCDVDIVERREQARDRIRGEHVKMGGVLVGPVTKQERQPTAQIEHVGDRSHEGTTRPKQATRLRDDALRETNVLEELSGDHGVETSIGKGKRCLDVGQDRLDAQLGGRIERHSIDVQPDDDVAVEEMPGNSAAPATEVENPLSRSPQSALEIRDPLRNEHEIPVISSAGVIVPPAFVNFTAFDRRFRTTC